MSAQCFTGTWFLYLHVPPLPAIVPPELGIMSMCESLLAFCVQDILPLQAVTCRRWYVAAVHLKDMRCARQVPVQHHHCNLQHGDLLPGDLEVHQPILVRLRLMAALGDSAIEVHTRAQDLMAVIFSRFG